MKALLDPWWAQLASGEPVGLAFIKLDRVGSTLDWRELPDADVQRRRQRFVAGVEQLAMDFGAVQPLHWQGDGVLLVLPCRDDAELELAWRAARALWERQTIELNIPTRIALHAAADVAWEPDTGKLAHPAIDLCGHLEHDAPEKAIAISEDVALALPASARRELAVLGVTKRDGLAAFVFPAAAAERRRAEAFADDTFARLWQCFRAYANSAPMRHLRYAGLRLAKKEPPSLDVARVFIRPRVALRRGRVTEPRSELVQLEPEKKARLQHLALSRMSLGAHADSAMEITGALRQWRALAVVGEPGSGKTTLLRWLAVAAAGGRLTLGRATGLAERLLPLPVSVGRLAEIRASAGGEISVVDALARYFEDRSIGPRTELAAFLRAALDAAECLVLLDGLDEVKSEDRRAVAEWLESFAAVTARNRFVVTSRLAGYAGVALPDGVEVTLQPFDEAQTERYVGVFERAYVAWERGADDPALAKDKARDLVAALNESSRLRDLSRNPLLLHVLAVLHARAAGLPRHRVLVYQTLAKELCVTRGIARRLVAASEQPAMAYEEEAVPILGDLAIAMHADVPSGLAAEADVLPVLGQALVYHRSVAERDAEHAARDFLRRATEDVGLLVYHDGRYSFQHLAFQEFFVAVGLHAQGRFEEEAFAHLFDPLWEEVIRLGVGHWALVQGRPEKAGQVVRRVLDTPLEREFTWITGILRKQVPLAALLAAEAGDALPQDDRKHVADALTDWLLTPPTHAAAWEQPPLRVFRELDGSSLGNAAADALIGRLNRDDAAVRWRAYVALGQLGSQKVIAILGEELARENWSQEEDKALARDAAADALLALGTPAARDALLAAPRTRSGALNPSLVRRLARWPQDDPVIEDALVESLDRPPAIDRMQTAVALLRMRPELACRALSDVVATNPPWAGARTRVLTPPTLTHAAAERIFPACAGASEAVRRVISWVVARAAIEQHLPDVLDRLLSSRDEPMRAAAADVERARAAPPSVIDRRDALELLASPDAAERARGVHALGEMRDLESVPRLIDALNDQVVDVRELAWLALWEISDSFMIDAARVNRPPAFRGSG